ncbi:MAG: glycosyl transferase family protein [Bacteroidetes bacterium]|nr:glycosyl transferase family protein [Bacteroidota bacterium]
MPKHTRILVVRTDRVGDVVLATPLIRALRRTFPDAHIAALVRPYTRDVLLHNPHLNEILVDDPDGAHAGRSGFWDQVGMLRSRKFDTALLLLPTERMAWMLLVAGIRTRIGVGTKLYEVLTFMRTVSRHKYIPLRHEADYCLDLGRAIGVRTSDLAVELFLTEGERRAADARLRAAGNAETGTMLIGMHPGSGKSAPNWRIERYVELAGALLERYPAARIVVTGSEAERDFSRRFRATGSERVIDFVGALTLRDLMGVISRYSLLVSASTGPMHLAAGLGVPTLSLFCPLTACSPRLWGPQGNRAEVVLPSERYCQTRCPGDPHVCQFEGGIHVPQVADAAGIILGERTAGR